MYNNKIRSMNSPLSPITPLEQIAFTFSPTVLSGMLGNGVTPKILKQSFRRNSNDSLHSSICISPLDGNILTVPNNTPLLGCFSTGNRTPNQAVVLQCAKSPAGVSKISILIDGTESPMSKSKSPNVKWIPSPKLSPNSGKSGGLNMWGLNAPLNDAMSVDNILDDIGVGYLAALFSKEEIDLNVFFYLTENDLCEIGVHRNEREKIMKFLNDLDLQ